MDPTIPKNESGHPIRHELTRAIPTSQCIVCHIHPGTNMVASYLGYIWWDSETDGSNMYPAKQHEPTDAERLESWTKNTQDAAAGGVWRNLDFLAKEGTPECQGALKNAQLGECHGQ